MMTSKERFQTVLNHRSADRICVDFGATAVTGMHIRLIEALRRHYGLDDHPIKIADVFQMIGEIEPDLQEVIGVDIVGIKDRNTMFGFPLEDWKEFKTPWGQVCLVPGKFTTDVRDANGDYLMFPEGDTSLPPSGRMPQDNFFYDAIIRQDPIDDSKLNVEDNLEEFGPIPEESKAWIKRHLEAYKKTDKGIIMSIGGMQLGDVAAVPGVHMRHPKGIRDIAEWYMSTVMRPDYVKAIFERQTDIAVENLKTIYDIVGNDIDVMFICGTDLGTQDSQFCSDATFRDLYLPYYKKMNDWIHQNTTWKTFKHSCGAMVPLLPGLIDAGFDIINPVQINAKGMDSKFLKREFGDKLVFWGGGVDTQITMMHGTPAQVRDEVKRQCDIFGQDGGFVFNAVHNLQANMPVENAIAMIDTLREINHL